MLAIRKATDLALGLLPKQGPRTWGDVQPAPLGLMQRSLACCQVKCKYPAAARPAARHVQRGGRGRRVQELLCASRRRAASRAAAAGRDATGADSKRKGAAP